MAMQDSLRLLLVLALAIDPGEAPSLASAMYVLYI